MKFETIKEATQHWVDGFNAIPLWGWLWMFGERIDEDWARENLEKVAECGFRIFEDADSGDIYIGIDGAGYDFYEQHWIPLYNARGLKWHKGELFPFS